MKTAMVVSGGDAPGINTVLAHYASLAAQHGDQLVGAMGGIPGLITGNLVPLTPRELAPWSVIAGSYLGSSREAVLTEADAREKLVATLQAQQIDNLVLFGGNGTLKYVLPLLRDWGFPCIGLPTTIDNDVPGTQRTLGFDSACNYAYQAIDGIIATGHALNGRIFVVETLGGDSGNLPLAIALGSRAHAVVLKEYEYVDDWLAQRLKYAVNHFGLALCVVGERARDARSLPERLFALTDIRVRDTRLGHAQRGGAPTHLDRVLAVQMAHTAYTALRRQQQIGVVVVRHDQVSLHAGLLDDFPPPLPDRAAYDLINGLTP